jgi:2-polyprenyl-3-methyl-5-hydroxy-6-metoxy-1,4-benzoquinol methylase
MYKSKKLWDFLSHNYDRGANKSDKSNNKPLENIKKYLNANDVFLDYGCATGKMAIDIAAKVEEVHGIDISSKMIEAAEMKAAERKIANTHFVQTTIFDKQFDKESFNAILALSVLHLLKDTQSVIQRINELLKPGGFFFSTTPCLGEKTSFLSNFLFLLSKIPVFPDIRLFKSSELEELIGNGNIQIVETEYLAHNPVFYYIVAKKI